MVVQNQGLGFVILFSCLIVESPVTSWYLPNNSYEVMFKYFPLFILLLMGENSWSVNLFSVVLLV